MIQFKHKKERETTEVILINSSPRRTNFSNYETARTYLQEMIDTVINTFNKEQPDCYYYEIISASIITAVSDGTYVSSYYIPNLVLKQIIYNDKYSKYKLNEFKKRKTIDF